MISILTLALATLFHLSDGLDNATWLWGPYRPSVYLGIQPQIPKSLLMGIMWSNVDDPSKLEKNLRHTCDADKGIADFGWNHYDSRTGGSQTFNDTGNGVDIVADFVKSMDSKSQEWQLRVRGVPRTGAAEHQQTTVIFYLGSESPASKVSCKKQHSHRVLHSDISCQGTTPTIGEFSVDIGVSGDRTELSQHLVVNSIVVPSKNLWHTKAVFLNLLKSNNIGDGMLPNKPGEGNLHFVQIIFEGSNEIEVSFISGHRNDTATPVPFARRIEDIYANFKKQFGLTFLPQRPFEDNQYTRFSQSLLSNLMGGIGFFYGSDRICLDSTSDFTDTNDDFWMYASLGESQQMVQERAPRQLITAVPSRPSLSRGFLWDEGFHLELILEWDMDLALSILSSWFDLIDDDGWIAHEQILGPDARSKVPSLYQVQFPHFASPPTLFVAVENFVEMLQREERGPSISPRQYITELEAGKAWLDTMYPKLKKNYDWFRKTQSGNMTHYRHRHRIHQGYRWRGRTSDHIQTSGLGDYPRAQPPHLEELHVDALSWVGSMATTLRKISVMLGKDEDKEIFSEHEANVKRSLDEIHWSAASQTYCDTTIGSNNQINHVCHKGYLSLFPFLLGHLNSTHPHLEATLDLIRNPGEIWTVYGLRSLSKSNRYYSKGDNYCRGSIWVNINYMVLKQLLRLSAEPGPLQGKIRALYSELRINIVDTVYTSWSQTNTVWEQYNPENGEGQRTPYFTGWTALVSRIMKMPDLMPSASVHRTQSKLHPGHIVRSGYSNNTLIILSGAILLACLVYRKKLSLLISRMRP